MESLFRRAAGQLIHVTSLPPRLPGQAHRDSLPGTDGPWSLGDLGSGDIGPGAYEFLRFLHRSGQRWWQILPTGPIGYGYSPYQSPSSFAGNPWLISPALLVRDGLLKQEDLEYASSGVTPEDLQQVNFHKLAQRRFELLRLAFRRQPATRPDWTHDWENFRHRNRDWLDEHCLFTACKANHQERSWLEWEPGLQRREPEVLEAWRHRLQGACDFESFVQYVFERQWRELRAYASSLGIGIIGDIPIFVSMDSSDVWAQQHLFELDEQGRPICVAGVPPDYFSETGQRWGNPLYRWDQHSQSGYAWWIRRFQKVLEWCDLIRIDHFRGFESYYAIPAQYPDAKIGHWRVGPRHDFFQTIAAGLNKHPQEQLPVIAEDLGFITPEVHQLRDAFGFPGMRILQFGFGDGLASSLDLPHNYPAHCVAYTGTHDNDTVVGWFESVAGEASTRTQQQIDREKAFALRYLDCSPDQIHHAMMRAIWRSVASLAITPIQDLLGLGTTARMNVPGTTQGNWIWRCPPGLLTEAQADWLGELTETYGRSPSVSAAV
ncbi:MAG: 4-alpha-glucanotransferase [Pirellula sp.]